jgi:pyruvate/2-oxoglutarate/acetoin dehydrogenase E1 component
LALFPQAPHVEGVVVVSLKNPYDVQALLQEAAESAAHALHVEASV